MRVCLGEKVVLALLRPWLCLMMKQITKGKLWSALIPLAKQISSPTLHFSARWASVSSVASTGDTSPALLMMGFVLLSSTLAEARAALTASLLCAERSDIPRNASGMPEEHRIIASANIPPREAEGMASARSSVTLPGAALEHHGVLAASEQ